MSTYKEHHEEPTQIATVKLYNLEIHHTAQLSPLEFLERTRAVEFIRSRPGPIFTFYPSTENEINNNRLLWECVNGNHNAIHTEHRKYFVVEFPEWLYLFLRFTPYEKVEKAIIVALAGWYVYNPDKREVMERQLQASIFSEVKKLQKQYFSEFEDFTFIMSDDMSLWDDLNENYYRKEKLFMSRYDYVYRDLVANPLLVPYIYPVESRRFSHKSIFHYSSLNLELESSYFTGTDWEKIIHDGVDDSLSRSESRQEPWEEWRSNFGSTHKIRF